MEFLSLSEAVAAAILAILIAVVAIQVPVLVADVMGAGSRGKDRRDD